MKKKAKNMKKNNFEVLTPLHLLKIKGGIVPINPPETPDPFQPARNN